MAGRFWICRKLHDDFEYWYEHNESFEEVSADLPHEPAIIAAALAFRPVEPREWDAVEAWSWVYRHALMLEIGVDDFEEWCVHQTAKKSRVAVLTELMRTGQIAALSSDHARSVYDPANGNA